MPTGWWRTDANELTEIMHWNIKSRSQLAADQIEESRRATEKAALAVSFFVTVSRTELVKVEANLPEERARVAANRFREPQFVELEQSIKAAAPARSPVKLSNLPDGAIAWVERGRCKPLRT